MGSSSRSGGTDLPTNRKAEVGLCYMQFNQRPVVGDRRAAAIGVLPVV